jgi:hypothetical protein
VRARSGALGTEIPWVDMKVEKNILCTQAVVPSHVPLRRAR